MLPWDPQPDLGVLALDTEGTAGDFYTIGGVQRSRLAALDLATGRPIDWNPGASSTVRALLVDGSTVYVSGAFTTIGGVAQSNRGARRHDGDSDRVELTALDPVTGLATAWNPNANNIVYCAGDLRGAALRGRQLHDHRRPGA